MAKCTSRDCSGLKELIPEINKTIFNCYDDMNDIKEMLKLKMNYAAIINLYNDIEISTIINNYKKGYDIHNILKDIPYQEGNNYHTLSSDIYTITNNDVFEKDKGCNGCAVIYIQTFTIAALIYLVLRKK